MFGVHMQRMFGVHMQRMFLEVLTITEFYSMSLHKVLTTIRNLPLTTWENS